MVRRDEADRDPQGERASSCCASPAGESPAPVSVGAPASRPPVPGEIPATEAGRQEGLRTEQARGPQHQVKLAASKEKQSGSRVAHVTAKATSAAHVPKRVVGRGGVWSAARVQGEVRNSGDPSALPRSGQGAPYKPKAKSAAAQRESEGVVVPSIVAQNNATGGKGLCFGHAREEGKREGMAGKTGPNHPDGHIRPAFKHDNLDASYGYWPSGGRNVTPPSCIRSGMTPRPWRESALVEPPRTPCQEDHR